MKKILFVGRMENAPSHRFRFEQYLPYLRKNGFDYEFSNLLNRKENFTILSNGNFLKKAGIILKAIGIRIKNIFRLYKYDIIFVQREALIVGPPIFEWIFSITNAKMVFDFDDSVWLHNVSEFNKYFAWLKFHNKTKTIIKLSDLVFAGNEYLAQYALTFNHNVKIIPSSIDTDVFKPVSKDKYLKDKICIGWSGSETTIMHFKLLEDVLLKLKSKYNNRIYFKVIGTANYTNKLLDIVSVPWNMDTEIMDLSEIEIGLMPLPNDDWSKGKCGLKGLSYMAMEIATIMSPVGVNSTIIKDGYNGFLAADEQEWIDKLSILIDDRDLSKDLGKAGRETVLKHYSTNATKHKFVDYLKQL